MIYTFLLFIYFCVSVKMEASKRKKRGENECAKKKRKRECGEDKQPLQEVSVIKYFSFSFSFHSLRNVFIICNHYCRCSFYLSQLDKIHYEGTPPFLNEHLFLSVIRVG